MLSALRQTGLPWSDESDRGPATLGASGACARSRIAGSCVSVVRDLHPMPIGGALMDTQLMWIIAAAVVVFVLVALFVLRRQRSERLRQRFGPEYERTVREAGDVRKAEAALQARAARVERLHIRPLSAGGRAAVRGALAQRAGAVRGRSQGRGDRGRSARRRGDARARLSRSESSSSGSRTFQSTIRTW